MDITIQMIITDKDAKFWLKAHDVTMGFGEGDVDNTSFTSSFANEIGLRMLFSEDDATSAYMTDDITIEGNLKDAMAFQQITKLVLEALEDLFEEF